MHERLLLVRADAGPGVGNGHVVRCTALAEEWLRQGGTAVLATASIPDDLRSQVVQRGLGVQAVEEGPASFGRLVKDLHPAWVVVDGYRFGRPFHEAARPARVAVVDDHGTAGAYDADVIVDQNLGATTVAYEGAVGRPRLLIGPRYVLLRTEFVTADHPRRAEAAAEVAHVLVSLGGAPDDEVRSRVVDAVELAAVGTGSRTVLGAGAPVSDMASLLAQVDLAVTASGSIVWELCHFGVPMLVIPVAENQRPLARELVAAGAALGAPPDASAVDLASTIRMLAADRDLRSSLARRAGAIVDGLGARRVVAALRGAALSVRPAVEEDADLLFRWANDPVVRAASFHTDPIEWIDHVHWVQSTLESSDAQLMIVSDEGGDLAQFRAVRDGDEATVGTSIDPSRRGEHLAPAVIDRCSTALLGSGWALRLHAWIRPDNAASQRSFALAGYDEVGAGDVGGVAAVHYARQ